MADYKNSALYKVRKWMISELYGNGILNEAHYVNISPIFPIQQVPESGGIRDYSSAGLPEDAPFIIYDYITPGGYDTDYWNCRDEISLWIYDYDIEKIFEIKDFLYDLLRRFDLSATDINEFSDSSPYQFHWFDIMAGLPTDEADEVLGRKGINIVVEYEYTRPILSNGRFA